MSKRQQRIDSVRADVARVRAIPAGTRMLCRTNGKTYQLGAKHGMAQFWMLQEGNPEKGLVHAATIIQHFEVLR